MNKKEAKKRIKKLKKVIRYHRYLYHVLNRQEISPEVLDSLKHELYKLEQRFPEFITPDSPTQRVAGKPLEKFQKVKHKVLMLSIEDIFSDEELQNWQDYLKRLEPSAEFEYFCELKVDGFATTLIYKNGFFDLGATRGDGKIGEDVTQNLKTIESIPLKLEIHPPPNLDGGLPTKEIEKNLRKKIKKGEIEIRGEVYMDKVDFKKLNRELQKRGEKTYANPRNLAAGSIRQLDPKLAASRPLKFLAYNIITDLGQTLHSQGHQILSALGFKTDPGKVCKNLEEVIDFWRRSARKREKFPFQIDGIVINVNQNSLFQKLGVVGKSPRGVRAFKFSPRQATTQILDIKLQVGRTGAVTPVAVLKPVEVGGVTVSRATLHNEEEIKRLGVKVGDTVIVERAGDVIPAVAEVMPELRTGKEKKFRMPKECPVCGQNLVRPKEEVVWRCSNRDCQARRREFLYHFVSKKAFDVEGLGPKIIDKLIDAGLVSDPVDLFKLEIGDILPLEGLPRRKPKAFLRGFAKKSAKNLINSLQNSKKIPLHRFIYALGIRYVGEETAIDLARFFGSINKLKKASKENLEAIPDIGGVGAESIYNWFSIKRNQRLIEDLLKAGIKILPPKKIGRKLKGFTLVITGALKAMTRYEAQKRIRLLGGHPAPSISEKTDFLIVGKDPGPTKLEKAKKLGIKIIDEKEFLKMIKQR